MNTEQAKEAAEKLIEEHGMFSGVSPEWDIHAAIESAKTDLRHQIETARNVYGEFAKNPSLYPIEETEIYTDLILIQEQLKLMEKK